MIAASPLSADEYAMRIATQTEFALICKEYSSSCIVSPIPVFPAPQRTPSPMGRRLRYTPYRASCKQTTTVQSSGHGKTLNRSSSRLYRVSSDFSGCLPPVSSGLGKLVAPVSGEKMEKVRKLITYDRQLAVQGRESIEEEPRWGRNSVSKTAKHVVKVRDFVRPDRRLTVRMILEELNLNHTTVHQILTNELKMRMICAKMVSKILSQ
ncbi:uncharacterized protein TNCV_1046531 [Trichonephila clavipes]|nr:uncharacterized protein TNCV_1046531 [Trichonephila clavipes]